MSILKLLEDLKGQLNPSDNVPPELYLMSEAMKVMAGQTSQVIDYFLIKTQSDANQEAHNFLQAIKDYGQTVAAGENTEILNMIGEPNGIAELGSDGKVPASQLPPGNGGSLAWGDITGTLSDQTDLQSALDSRFKNDESLHGVDGSAGNPTYGFASDGATDTGMYWMGDGHIGWSVNGQLGMELDPSKNLTVQGIVDGANLHGSPRSILGFDVDGALNPIPGWAVDVDSGGLRQFFDIAHNGDAGGFNGNILSLNFQPTQDAPDQSWTLQSVQARFNDAAFAMGRSGEAVSLLNLYAEARGNKDLGAIALLKNNFDIGNGTDAITVKGVAYTYGFGNIANNVVMDGPIQGHGFQPTVASGATLQSQAYINAFYDFANINTDMGAGYNSFIGNPNIKSIPNNNNYVGLNLFPSIENLYGNANAIGVAVGGNFDSIENGYQGVSINPTVGMCNNATGLNVYMNNVTVYAGVKPSLTLQDLFFESKTAGEYLNQVTVEYINDGTAGAETASLVGFAITVHIESGVSTASQVRAALLAVPSIVANLNITITGTASNPQTAVGATSLTGGINPGYKKAAYLGGDVQIDGDLSFSGALSIGALNAYHSQALTDGGGQPSSTHLLISAPTVADNTTLANADHIGVNTASLMTFGDNSVVTTAFLGISAIGLPAVVKVGANTTVDRISGATFALSLDSGAGAGGSIDEVSLCQSLAIPNGITGVNKLIAYKFDLPFGNPGTETWGVYLKPDVYNWIKGSLKLGGTAGSTDKVDSGIQLQVEGDSKLNGKLSVFSDNIQAGTQDPFSRNQIWNKAANSVLRMGSWGQDGDVANTVSEGMVVYGDSLTGQPLSGSDGGYARIKSNRFGLFTVDSTLPAFNGGDYFFRIDDTGEYFKDNSGNKSFEVDRASGRITTLADSIRVKTAKTPSSASDTGSQGEIAWDSDYVYVCVAANTWKRSAISSW